MRQIGDTIYTINEIHQSVSKWKILEINDEVYRCQNKRTEKIREFSERDAIIFDTREDAMKVIRQTKRKKFNLYNLFTDPFDFSC